VSESVGVKSAVGWQSALNFGDRIGTSQDRAGHDVGWFDESVKEDRFGVIQRRFPMWLVHVDCGEPESGTDLWMGSEFLVPNRGLHRDELEGGRFVNLLVTRINMRSRSVINSRDLQVFKWCEVVEFGASEWW